MNIIFRYETFDQYGLDVEKNFLEAPMCCKEKCSLGLPESKNMFLSGLHQILEDVKCGNCAIFAHSLDGTYCAMLKRYIDGEDKFFVAEENNKDNIKFFQEIAESFELHTYALIVQTDKETWKVIEQ